MRNERSRSLGQMHRVGLALAIVGALAGASGCKKLLRKGLLAAVGDAGLPGLTEADGTGPVAAASDDPDDQLQDKIDAFIVCQNTISSRIHDSRRRYFSWVAPDKPLTGKERYAYGLYEVDAAKPAECAKNIAAAKTLPPSNPKLEALGDEFAAAAAEITATINEANKYYDAKDWRDDKWAKGKELDPKLKAGWKRFQKVDHELHEELSGITKPLARRSLARIEKEEGKSFRYHRKSALITARELIESGQPDDDASVDFALYDAAFKEFDAALTELTTYGSAHKADLENPGLRTNILASSNYDAFVREADDFRKKSKEYLRCLRDAPAKAKVGSMVDVRRMPECHDGRFSEIVREYNQLIDHSNSRQFP